MTLNCISFNARGLRDKEKRRAVFDFYRTRCDILLIQETHSVSTDEKCWTAEWGSRILFSHGVNNARGTAMCINKKVLQKLKINNIVSDADGRYIMCLLTINEVTLHMCGIYAPNVDSPGFFENLFRKSHEACDKLVIIGDFNTVLNTDLDKKGGSKCCNRKSIEVILSLMEELVLTETWRDRNPEARRFSWYRGKYPNIQASRLDYAIMSAGLSKKVHDVFYMAGLMSDHSAYFVGFELEQCNRGSGFWKFNVSLLGDVHLVRNINEAIQDAKVTYKHLDPTHKWEKIKTYMKTEAIKYSRTRGSESRLILSQLTEKITEMENDLNVLTEQEMEILQNTKDELHECMSERAKGLLFRSKVKWSMEAERNTAYFYNLERAKYNAKTCTSLINESGQLVKDDRKILKMQTDFYQELYTADDSVSFEIEDVVENKADDIIATENIPLSVQEVKNAIKSLKNGSCPGSDGLPSEVYKVFWSKFEEDFMAMLHHVYSTGCLHPTASMGILNLIPKGQKDTRYLKNMRPITLLNTDYKIIEKCVSNRILPSLQEIIHSDQTGFLPHRRIAANIRKVLDVVTEMDKQDRPGIILECDFLKCFDRVEFQCVIESLKMFWFSSVIQEWTKILYSKFQIKVQNNGNFATELINVSRGLHQGRPASNVYFLAVAELLANILRADQRIQGLYVKEILQFLNQYADDLGICMENDEDSISAALEQFERFRRSTGFTLSYDKTTVYRVGSLKHSKAKMYTARQLNWVEDQEGFVLLGVNILNDPCALMETNYQDIMCKVGRIIRQWESRNLSLLGKISVVNTLIASLFVYRMSVLPAIPGKFVVQLNEMVEKFVWSGHKPKIPMKCLQASYAHGGLQLVDFVRKDKSLKASWVKLIMDGMYDSRLVYDIIQRDLQGWIWCCNFAPCDVKDLEVENRFWNDVLCAWAEYHYSPVNSTPQVLWFNLNIKSDGKMLWNRQVFHKGLITVSDLIEEGKMMSCERAETCYNLSTHEYNVIKCSIPAEYRRHAKENYRTSFTDKKFAEFMKHEQCSRYIYYELGEMPVQVANKEDRWQEETGQVMCIPHEVQRMKKITVISKYRSFQYRTLMRAIVTNIQLMHWKLRETDLCTWCETKRETCEHLFYSCVCIKPLWEGVKILCRDMFREEVLLTYHNIVTNSISPTDHAGTNFVCLLLKQYIYRSRCCKEKMSLRLFKSMVFEAKNVEKYYAKQEGKLRHFYNKWERGQSNTINTPEFEQYELIYKDN